MPDFDMNDILVRFDGMADAVNRLAGRVATIERRLGIDPGELAGPRWGEARFGGHHAQVDGPAEQRSDDLAV